MNVRHLKHHFFLAACLLGPGLIYKCAPGRQEADTILFNGKIITVDKDFSIAEAVAIKDGKFLATGTSGEILRLRGDSTHAIDLQGRVVVPGLIEGHAHPVTASQSEHIEKIPDLRTIKDLFEWITDQAQVRQDGQWIIHPKFFISRLVDARPITIHELDSLAPDNPVFLDGSFSGLINSKALELSGLTGSGHPGILRNKATGEPNGIVRSAAFGLLKTGNEDELSEDEQLIALEELLRRYNELGITSVCSAGGPVEELEAFEKLQQKGRLTVRIVQNIMIPFDRIGSVSEMRSELKQFGFKTGDGNDWVSVGALKVILDGGVLTGTAFLRSGWGEGSMDVFGISDPGYRGELFFSRDELIRLIQAADKEGWRFTAHVTGGGGVDTLMAAFETVNRSMPVSGKRFSVIHGNFYTPDAMRKMAAMGILADMQPAWYFSDSDFLSQVLSEDEIRTFHPYRSMTDAGIVISGGSDHMAKLDADSSINPYNPFLAMWSLTTRKTNRGSVFNPEEAISREEALKIYTINNAYASFDEDIKGSIEPGKLADLAVLSDDILTCADDSIRQIRSLLTMVNGRIVFSTTDMPDL